jgi:ketosteroid isomerase-like protein
MTECIGILFSGVALAAAASIGADAEGEVRAAMMAWREATLAQDGATLDKLLHQDLTYSHSNGRTQTKVDVLSSVAGGKSSVTGIDFDDLTVRVYQTTALVKGIIDVHSSKAGVAATAHLDILHVWIKGKQGWQMVARQATQATA